MNHHYVLAPHDPVLAERATALVEAHQPGHGIRAIVSTQRPGDFHHVIALQARDDSSLRLLLTQLQLPEQHTDAVAPSTGTSSPLMLSVCGDIPCEQMNQRFGVVPSKLPLCDAIVFLVMELDRDVHEIVDDFVLPPVGSHLAGVAIADGRTLLVELANDDPAQLEKDIAAISSIAHVVSIRTVHAAGRDQVRSQHT